MNPFATTSGNAAATVEAVNSMMSKPLDRSTTTSTTGMYVYVMYNVI